MIVIISKHQSKFIDERIKLDESNGSDQSAATYDAYQKYGINSQTMISSHLVAVELGNDTYRTIKDRNEEPGKVISGAYLRKKIENIMDMRFKWEFQKTGV